MSWWWVILAVLLFVGVMAYVTLYLPSRKSNIVTVGDLTVSLQARPDQSVAHGVEVDATVIGAIDDGTTADISGTMPTMSGMPADVMNQQRLDSGHYQALLSLPHAGLWQVQVSVHRPGLKDATATFSLNA